MNDNRHSTYQLEIAKEYLQEAAQLIEDFLAGRRSGDTAPDAQLVAGLHQLIEQLQRRRQ